eukprot:365710-Chlamydomonas_euryale.AAC.3
MRCDRVETRCDRAQMRCGQVETGCEKQWGCSWITSTIMYQLYLHDGTDVAVALDTMPSTLDLPSKGFQINGKRKSWAR